MQAEMVRYLVEQGADLSHYMALGLRSLHRVIDIEMDSAVQAGETESPAPVIARRLLDLGADIHALDYRGRTPFQLGDIAMLSSSCRHMRLGWIRRPMIL